MSEYRQMESDDSLPDLSEEINYKAPKSGWLTTGARTPPTSKGTQKTITLTEEKDYLTKVQKRENSKKTLGKTSKKIIDFGISYVSQNFEIYSDISYPFFIIFET